MLLDTFQIISRGIIINKYSYKGEIITANSREEAIKVFAEKWEGNDKMKEAMESACKIAGVDDIGKLSDGYHTFDDLYFQRLVLWQRICNDHKDICWKTKCHDDGELCFGGTNFLIAMDTPQGTYSYHYPIEEWDRFDVKELPKAKPFDGHTSKDVERILSI